MSDTQQGPGWWLASDGKWYPPEQAPPPQRPTYTPEQLKSRSRKIWAVLGVGVAIVAVWAIVAANDDRSNGHSPPSSGQDFTGSDGGSLSSAERQLVAEVDAIYPGIAAPRYIVNWSTYLCDDLDDGMSGDALIGRTIVRYSGGSRPDPTPAQAAQILDVIESSGFCT